MTLDVYNGKSANWDSRAIQIIEYLLTKQGGDYTYAEIAKSLKIPTVEVSRYLRKQSFERRDDKWLLDMRKYKPKAYEHYLMNHHIRIVDGLPVRFVNFSKHDILLMNCRLKNVDVVYQRLPNGRQIVHLFQKSEDQRINAQYLVPTASWNELYGDEYDTLPNEYDALDLMGDEFAAFGATINGDIDG